MNHVVLLGDSIFDNARYVPGRPALVDQVRGCLPPGWRVSLLAVDGHITEDVAGQLAELPADVSHLCVSVGGNDALGYSGVLFAPAESSADVFARLSDIYDQFRRDYRAMLGAVLARQKPTVVCTIYDSIPGLDRNALTGLMGFNDCILREAFEAGLPVIDLRFICGKAADYSHVSSIEPSAIGGAKIAGAITQVVTRHDFSLRQTVVYTSWVNSP
jgi:hypothetical protein